MAKQTQAQSQATRDLIEERSRLAGLMWAHAITGNACAFEEYTQARASGEEIDPTGFLGEKRFDRLRRELMSKDDLAQAKPIVEALAQRAGWAKEGATHEI